MLKLESWALNGLNSHVAGQLLLRQMYEAHTGEEMPDIGTMHRGKPYFLTGDLHFSITHTKNTVFCALSDSPVGIDAEELTRKVSPSMAEKILSPDELAQYQALEDPEEQNLALLRFWVLKEAEVKCSGLGLRGYPNHTNFRLDDPRVQVMDGCLVAVIRQEDVMPASPLGQLPKEVDDAL